MSGDPIPRDITIGEKYHPAMAVQTEGEARSMFERLVSHTMSWGHAREKAEEIERSNLGYFAGYYDSETRVRVERLYRCVHPIFGRTGAVPVSAVDALAAGQAAAKGGAA